MKLNISGTPLDTGRSKTLADCLIGDGGNRAVRLCEARDGRYFAHVIGDGIYRSSLANMFGPEIEWFITDDHQNAYAIVDNRFARGFSDLGFPTEKVTGSIKHNETFDQPEQDSIDAPKLPTKPQDKSHQSWFVRGTIIATLFMIFWMFRYETLNSWSHRNRLTGAMCPISQECWFKK